MQVKELSLKTKEELIALERDIRIKIRDIRFSISTGQVKTVREMRRLKHDLARILSVSTKKPQLQV
jgi:ribosomal protein L29